MFGSVLGSLIQKKTPGVYRDPHPEDAFAWAQYKKENKTWNVISDPRGSQMRTDKLLSVNPARAIQIHEQDLKRAGPAHGIHPPYRFPHVNGPQTIWNPKEVEEADRQGIHPSRLSTTPYAARYSNLPPASAHPGIPGISEPTGAITGGLSPLLAVGLGGTPWSQSTNRDNWGVLRDPTFYEDWWNEVPSSIRETYAGVSTRDLSTQSGAPLVIPFPELPPYYYILADSRAPENHPLNWPGSPTVIPRPGDKDVHGEPIGYSHRESVSLTYRPSDWAAKMGFDLFPDFALGAAVPSELFSDTREQLRVAQARIVELELGQDETPEVQFMDYPSGISQEAYEWYLENRPGYLDAVGGPGDTWPDQFGIQDPPPMGPAPTIQPYQPPTVEAFFKEMVTARGIAKSQEKQAMGWFDSLLDVLPDVLAGTGAIIQATNQPSYIPQAGPAPMQVLPPAQLPSTSWSGSPAGTTGYTPALFEGLWQGLPGQQLGEPQPTAYGSASSMYYQTAAGQPRTRDLLESVDWNGDRRYWVGGKKLSKRWIKSKILSESRQRKRCRPR